MKRLSSLWETGLISADTRHRPFAHAFAILYLRSSILVHLLPPFAAYRRLFSSEIIFRIKCRARAQPPKSPLKVLYTGLK
jgi:hypothetical protein